MEYVFLIIGFGLLILGANFLVDGSSSLAIHMKVPKVIVGATLVAIGTSIPELAVSVIAAIDHNTDMAFSNIIGSNIFNLLIIMGVCAMFKAVPIHTDILKRDFPWDISITVVLIVMLANSVLGRIDAIILTLFFVVYIYSILHDAKTHRQGYSYKEAQRFKPNILKKSATKGGVYAVLGIVMVGIGARFVVSGAEALAEDWNFSQGLMGLTIVAIGTSLPELTTSIIAVRKGHADMALGNVVGSNIFNALIGLAVPAMISPMPLGTEALIDVGILVIATCVVFFFAWNHEKTSRSEGIACLAIYVAFLVYVFLR
ncbi:MAG TPA: calcium/sodium antiporter [Anaerovoracaceae bacterium]|nr:calcium/sodium antiporter [Anaerovoracaceae bacterium]